MTTVMISSKGQITLPARLRKLAGLGLREPVVVAAEGDHLVVRKAGNILNWRGALGKGKAIDKERAAMMAGVAGHVRRKRP